MEFKLLHRSELDEAKWNVVISNSSTGLPYAYCWYLDCVAKEWKALVAGDYEAVMPIPVGKKLGISYIYQPLFCQQLGVFFKEKENSELVKKMLDFIANKYLYVQLNLNYTNTFEGKEENRIAKRNLILNLNNETIQKCYSENLVRNIKRANKADLYLTQDGQGFVEYYIQHTAVRDEKFKAQHKTQLQQLVQALQAHKMAHRYFVKNQNQEICAATLLVETSTRIIHLLPATSETGRANGAMHFLLDEIIQQKKDTGKVFDFEGSSVPSIARFYESFGAVEQPFSSFIKKGFSF